MGWLGLVHYVEVLLLALPCVNMASHQISTNNISPYLQLVIIPWTEGGISERMINHCEGCWCWVLITHLEVEGEDDGWMATIQVFNVLYVISRMALENIS